MLNRLKKLRKQFVFTNLVLVGVLLVTVATVVVVIVQRTAKNRVLRTLESIADESLTADVQPTEGSLKPGAENWEAKPLGDTLPTIYAYLMEVSPEGKIVAVSEETGFSDEAMNDIATAVLKNRKSAGELPLQALLYAKKPTDHQTVLIAFTNAEYVNTSRETAFLIVTGTCLVLMLSFFFLSRYLAGFFIRPVEEAWTSQGQFISDASHDLKTPLTVILANTEILNNDSSVSESSHRWIEGIREEAGRMRSLVERMLELAKTEELKGTLHFVRTDLSDLTERAALQMETVAFEKQVLLNTDIHPEVYLPTDAEIFTRLLYILIDNAIKYSPKNGQIFLSLTSSKQAVRLSIQNEGEIPQADLIHIFERFYRADKVRSVGGSGLGLSIAKNLSEAIRGNITVESKNGKTVFRIVFRRLFFNELKF